MFENFWDILYDVPYSSNTMPDGYLICTDRTISHSTTNFAYKDKNKN